MIGDIAEGTESVIVVRLRGRIVTTTVPRFVNLVHIASENQGAVFDVDLTEVEFIDSTGIGLLLILKERVESGHGAIRYRGVPPRVRRLLARTGADGILFSAEMRADLCAA